MTHFGLRQTLGEAQFNDFMDLVFEEHADEITGSPLAESYGFDPDAEMPENARLTKQRELAEEWLARKAEEIAPLLRRGIENAEVGRWRKFIGRIRQFLAEHRLLPKSYLDRLDDRTLTDLLRRTLGNAGYEFDAVREGEAGATDVSGRANVGDKMRAVIGQIPVEQTTIGLLDKNTDFDTVKKIFQNFPHDIIAADGKKILLQNPQALFDGQGNEIPQTEEERIINRLNHLTKAGTDHQGKTDKRKIQWLARTPETVQKAQIKLLNPASQCNAYVRRYQEGFHLVMVSPDGTAYYETGIDNALVTQFKENFIGTKGDFIIVWESASWNNRANQAGVGTGQNGAPLAAQNYGNITSQSNLSSPVGKKNQKNSGMPSVDPAAHLDSTLEDNMIEALLLPVKKANGELSALLDGGALKYLIDNGFPDVGNVTARYLTMEAKARLDEIKRKQSRAAAFQNYRDMDPLFDFIVEFAGGGENVIVNPGALQTVFHKKTRFFICFITKFLICFAFLSQNYRIFVAFYHEYIYFFLI